jgi:hypothetical protein
MTSRRNLLLTGITVAGGLLCFALGNLVSIKAQVTAPQAKVQPFYLERDFSGPVDNGPVAVFKKEFVARRSDGTTVLIETVGPMNLGHTVRSVMAPDGTAVSLFDTTKVKTTWPAMSDGRAADLSRRLQASSRDCGASPRGALMEFGNVQGQKVISFQERTESNYHTRRRALALACEELYYKNEAIQPDGSLALDLEEVTSQLILGEPDSRLFSINADYPETRPSEALTKLVSALGLTPSAEDRIKLRREARDDDARYLLRGRVPGR